MKIIYKLIAIVIGLISLASQTQAAYTAITYSGPSYGFIGPRAIAVDLKNNVWVADDYARVVKIPVSNPNSPVIFNDPKYQFENPWAIAADSTNNIWVVDLSGKVIRIPNGNPNAHPTIFSGSIYGFNQPIGLTIDSQNNVWITNYGNSTVTEIPAATPNNPIIFSGSQYQFTGPIGIKRDSTGNVWVINNDNQTMTEIPNGSPTATPIIYGTANTCSAQLCYPGSLTIDNNNNLWIPNYDQQLTKMSAINPNNFTVYSGAAYSSFEAAVDPTTGDIWTTFYDGNSVTHIPISNPSRPIIYASPTYTFSYPLGIAVDLTGNVWIANRGDQTVTELKKN